jgi:cytochrome oxidase Cu insertion factor (SCO1/SenC/PrrC family)
MTAPVARGRMKLLLIALIFLGPLVVAAWLYFAGQGLQPTGRTNAGTLLEPIVSLDEAVGPGRLSAATRGESDGHWVIVYVNPARCDEACGQTLYRMRQSRLMLGRDMTRLVRLFLHGEIAPDTVLLETEHEGLIAARDAALADALERKRPADLAPGGLYLIDPLGNLVIYFAAGLAPEDMVGDIEHLFDLSRIG